MSNEDFKQMVTPCDDPFPMNSDTEPNPAPTPRTFFIGEYEDIKEVVLASEHQAALAAKDAEIAHIRSKADECWGAANYRLKYLACLFRALGRPDDETIESNISAAAEQIREMKARAERAEAELAKQRSGEGSDGYHTFNELYEHRHALFLMLMRSHPSLSWISRKHHDGSEWSGWFIAGIKTPCGDISYHFPSAYWNYAVKAGVAVLETGMVWDGHTSAQVVDRLRLWAQIGTSISAERDQLRAEVERLNSLATHWERKTQSWNSMAVELGCLAGVSDNEVPWFDKAKAAINELRQLRAEVENIKAWANSKADEAQELRAELDACREVKERVAELTDYVSSQPWSRAGAYSTRSAIEHMKETEAALAAAKEDAERLEFLAVNAAEVRVEWDDGEGPIPPEFSIVTNGTGAIGRGPTLRAAIDAARMAQP